MRNGGRIPCNAIAICEMSKTPWQLGKLFTKGDSENHLQAQWFLLERWLNIIWCLHENSEGFFNLARKFCQEYSSDMHQSRGFLERRDSVCGRWGIGKDGRIGNPFSKNQCKRSIDATKERTIYIPRSRWYSKIVRKIPRLARTHSKAGTTCKEWRSQFWRTSRRTRRVSTDRIERWCWSLERPLVDSRWLHLSAKRPRPPGRWENSFMKGDSEYHLQARSYRLLRW